MKTFFCAACGIRICEAGTCKPCGGNVAEFKPEPEPIVAAAPSPKKSK